MTVPDDLGVVLRVDDHPSIESVLDMTEAIEDLGYTHVARNETSNTDAVSTLALMADRTTRLEIANDVFSPYSRSPALLGQTAATLQVISGGRYRLGIGASSPALAERWHGVPFDQPLRRVRETIEIVRRVVTGNRVTYDGEIYDLGGLRYDGLLPDTPPPIDVAALGPKATELAGRFADGWIPQYFTPEGFRERHQDYLRGLELAGRDRADVRVALTLRCCALDDPDEARQIARESVSFTIGAYGPYYRESIIEQGYGDAAAAIREAWDDRDYAAMADAVPDALIDDLVAAGTPEDVRAQLTRFAAIDGINLVRVGFFGRQSLDQQHETLRALAPR